MTISDIPVIPRFHSGGREPEINALVFKIPYKILVTLAGENFGALTDRIHGLKVEGIKEGNHSCCVGKPD